MSRRFAIGLAVVVAAGLLWRLVYLWGFRHGICVGTDPGGIGRECPGDSFVYHHGANLLADGKGFIIPTDYLTTGESRPGADHPPLFVMVLAAFSLLGARSWLWHQHVVVLISCLSIVFGGLLGREVAGERAGWIAAAFVAFSPFVWVNDALVMSEGLTIATVLLIAWLAVRFSREPTWRTTIALGIACGLAVLSRAETAMLVPLLVIPLGLMLKGLSWRDRLLRVIAAGAISVLVTAPWVVRNLTAFNNRVTLSTGLGITLANTNCDDTYYGPGLGFWSFRCIGPVPWNLDRDELAALDDDTLAAWVDWSRTEVAPGAGREQWIDALLARRATVDQSDDEIFLRGKGMAYLRDNQRRLPVVALARVGRTWNLFRPLQNTRFDVGEGRPLWVNRLGLAVFFPLIGLAVAGWVVLRRRGVTVLPFVVPLVVVTFATVTTFGQARYRTTAEGVLAVAAAVAVDAWWRRRQGAQPAADAPDGGGVDGEDGPAGGPGDRGPLGPGHASTIPMT